MEKTSSNSERVQLSHCMEQEQTSEVQQTSSDVAETSRVPRVPCLCAAPGRPKQFTCESCQVSVCRLCLPSHHLNCDQNSSAASDERKLMEVYSKAGQMFDELENMIDIIIKETIRVDSKVSKVKIMIRNLFTYKDELLNHRGQLTELLERYRFNLVQVADQRRKLTKSSNNRNKCAEVNSALETLEHFKIPVRPKTNLEYIVDVYDDVRNDHNLSSFNTSFCQLLRALTKSRELASFEGVEDSKADLLKHGGFWNVCSSTEADQAIKLLNETATRPEEVTVTIDIEDMWKNLNHFLSVLANHECVVRLDIYNMTIFPNEKNNAVIGDVLRHMRDTTPRYELGSFIGQLNLVTAKLLMEIAPNKEIGLQLTIRGADEMEGLRCLTSSCYSYISLYISPTAEPGFLSALPESRYTTLTIPDVTDNKLPWLRKVLTKLDCRGENVEVIVLSSSRLTEWGLKELLEFLEQAAVSNKIISVVTEALDQAAMNRTIQSYRERICSSIDIKSLR